MLIVRPVHFTDLTAIERLAVVAGGSMSTLPANRDHLSEMISNSQNALGRAVSEPAGETYHFVLEDTDNQQILGISGINSAVGINSPFYSYRVDQVVHASAELQIHNRISALNLCQDHTGSSSLCSLFLDPEHRNDHNLQLLSRARFLFIEAHRQRFADQILAELQGVQDAELRSPFWDALGRHFFNMDYARANYLTGIQSKSFIADLMPHHPVYLPLLPESAQQVIGQARPDIEPIRALLETEGFQYRGYVDIFDAGPTVETRTDRTASIQACQRLTLTGTEGGDGSLQLISNLALDNFRCLLAPLDSRQPQLSAACAEALGLAAGEGFNACPLTL